MSWQSITLGEAITLQRGYDLPEQRRITGSIPILGSAGVNGYHNSAKADGPGVVIGRSGASFGKAHYTPHAYWPHNTVLYVKDFKHNHPRFIYYLLDSIDFAAFNSGSAQPSLNRNYLYSMSIRFPSLSVQTKVAIIVSAYDDLIENNLRRIKILEEMAQNLYREWFVKFRFPGHLHARFVDTPLGRTPEGWEVNALSQAVIVRPSLPMPQKTQIPFVPMGSLSNDSMLISDIEYRSKASGARFQNGDTLFARITPCLENGKTGFVQFLPTDEAIACGSTEFIVLRSKTVCPEYVYLMARSEKFRDNAIKSMSGATGRQRVREECFDEFLLAQPPDEILERFQESTHPQFKMIDSLNRRNQSLRQTRDLLLPRLISGEVDVSELDITIPEELNA